MNTRCIPMITKHWLAVVLVLALLRCRCVGTGHGYSRGATYTGGGRGDLAQVKALLDKGANINARNEIDVTALMEARCRREKRCQSSYFWTKVLTPIPETNWV